MSENPDNLDTADGFVNQSGLFSPCDSLQAKHGIGSGRNEIRNQQG